MKHSTLQIQSKLLTQPWHGSAARVKPILASLLQGLRSERPEEDVFGDPLPKMSIVGDVALIPLVGVLTLNIPDWLKRYGLNLTDANDIAEELNAAVNNPAVSMIVIDSDSPGGLSTAGDKLFDVVEVAARRKPVFGWCADGNDCCSSAYEAVAPARAILCGRHAAAVGCIGSYMAMMDDTEFWKSMGITWEVFRSGDFKGMGEDTLTPEQRAWLQSVTDAYGSRFRKNVSKYRTEIPAEEMQGQYYGGIDAARLGFVAGNARDLSAAISKFRGML